MNDAQVKMALGGVADTNPVLVALLTVLRQHADVTNSEALSPGLTSEHRHFAAGAAFSLRQLDDAIRKLRE